MRRAVIKDMSQKSQNLLSALYLAKFGFWYSCILHRPSVLCIVGCQLWCAASCLHQFVSELYFVACRDRVWALSIDLQKHNEDKFVEAYRSATNVFLVYSVNMSGHFQGYAKMSSLPFKHQQVGTSLPTGQVPQLPFLASDRQADK